MVLQLENRYLEKATLCAITAKELETPFNPSYLKNGAEYLDGIIESMNWERRRSAQLPESFSDSIFMATALGAVVYQDAFLVLLQRCAEGMRTNTLAPSDRSYAANMFRTLAQTYLEYGTVPAIDYDSYPDYDDC
jgi:hypothetical protein